jgi:hypothetical protein
MTYTMTWLDPLGTALALVPVLYISCFLHEVGHAVMGRVAGFAVTSFGLGTKRPLVVIPLAGLRVFFCPFHPFQGFTFSFPRQLFPSNWRMALFLSGGILAHVALTLAALALAASMSWGGSVWLVGAGVNSTLAICNLVPLSFKAGKATLRSDGALILQTLRSGTIANPAPLLIQNVAFLRPLWEAVGDRLIVRANLLSAAVSWIELEDLERAEASLIEADSLSVPEPTLPSLRVFRELVAASLAQSKGELDDTAASLAKARSLLEPNGNGPSPGPIPLSLATSLATNRFLRGDAAGARTELDSLASSPPTSAHPRLAVMLLEPRLSVSVAMSDDSEVERLLTAYEGLRRTQPSATRDIRVYRSVARMHAGRQKWPAAELAYRRAIEAVGQVADLWADTSERARFVQKHTCLIEEACACLVNQDKAAEAEALTTPLLNTDLVRSRPDEARAARNRRLRRAGLRIMALNAVVSACTIGVALNLEMRYQRILGPPALVVALLTITSAIYLLFELAVGRLVPVFRSMGGAVILLLVCLPWLSVVFFLVFLILGPAATP